ncbi:ATP-binding cassette domain-containing protein [Rhodococcus sp. BP-252]|uniref:zinc ABC transporter ATP-binding protein AztA n=1 Tax=unclassified Rhodococcus (in: high G+C Gram-positive bacteria) TaxID=192944 RepID=UPI001C9A6A63|nr:ATP-binding cassette domain-containing protein [Rhodococcus sp. BP-320]MBY6419389.1 ATP-binding cassette domain-containing protein [Rhodococcus sp. BP-321]MBY6424435.1 ATP-binding cassette domain-containing protein [Rhodococcus sp. BP-324]MBY6429468.1 ATP-binding cassette domain-containing protein [Rhodococcus sp. BP-323]MBY6434444.1 ATP-binding cassette domain-containing protein [Rhodococcus sp. BP-322]MBY6443326.1 ATP-binding cassette domain-containing protein [Rhodococcus sp. BP-319]MBY
MVVMNESVTVRNLSVRYGNTTALHDVTASFGPGTVTALVGHNGSGKSTLLQSLAGIVTPSHGTVDTHRCSVAYVPQRSDVNDRMAITVGEVVAMGTWPRRGILGRATKQDRQAVDDAIARLKLTELRSRRLSTLSGGQRQRALLAQALVERGDLVLLDEPTTGLDAEARDIIDGVVDDEAARGAVVVMATHDLDDAQRAHTTITLGRGEVLSVHAPEHEPRRSRSLQRVPRQ